MNPKMLLPVLIALHLAAAALIVEGLDVDEQQSGRDNRTRQIAEWSPTCAAGGANEEFAPYWSSEYRHRDPTSAGQQSCVNIR
jgi:hypothetical protein